MSKRFVNFKDKIGKSALTLLLVGATTVGTHAQSMQAVTTANLNIKTVEATQYAVVTTIKNVEVIGTAKVRTGGFKLMLRAGQGTNTKILAKINDGSIINVVKDSKPVEGWIKVKVANIVGYVDTDFITNTQIKPEEKPAVIARAKVRTGGFKLMLRAGQGTNTKILAKINDGSIIDVVNDFNPVHGWTKVKVGNIVGYVDTDFITDIQMKPEENPEVIGRVKVRTGGFNLMLRAGQGTNTKILFKIEDGSLIEVVKDSKPVEGWIKVKVGYIVGYVDTDFTTN